MDSHEVIGGGGITLHVDETGVNDGRPILFIHGYTQSRLSWDKQMHSDLTEEFRIVALDNRGHGRSEKPRGAYADSALWADDIQAVIDTLGLEDPALVGWSYGGLIIADYLSVHGEANVGGVNMVGAISKIGTHDAMAVIGEDFVELVAAFESTDVEESVSGLAEFLRRCTYGDPSPQDLYYMLGFNAIVPPYVRTGLHSREVTHDALLAGIDSPVLITHGEEDTIVLPAAAQEHAEAIPNARTSFYPEVGHAPFWEDADRFNDELREFVSGL